MSEQREGEDYSGEGNLWIPDKSFYEGNPRSQKIRQVSLAITSTLDSLLHDPAVANDPVNQAQLYAELEKHNGELIELGIQPEMHMGKALKAFQSDPEIAAEFLAGQLVGLTGRRIPSETTAVRTAEEFGLREANQPNMLYKSAEAPQPLRDFVAVKSTVGVINEMFAAPQPPAAPAK